MDNLNTTTTVAPVEPAASQVADAGANTQSTSTQAEIAQTPANPLNSKVTNDVAVVKPAPKVEEVKQPTPEQLASKLDYTGLISKHIEEGSLSPEEFKSLEDAGLSKEQFHMLADAQKTIMLKNNDTLYSWVGGKDSYDGLKSFAAEHLSEQQATAYNSALNSGDMKLAEIAVLGLQALAQRERGKAPEVRLTSDGIPASNDQAYDNQQELIKDMNSRQYRNDPVFKATVDARRAKSGF